MMVFYKDELDEVLQDKLSLIESTPPRNPIKAKHGREVYMSQVTELQERKASILAAPLPQLHRKLTFGRRLSLASLTVALSFALILLFGGAWGVAYAAQDSMPNNFLYPAKLAGENLRLKLTINEETKIALLTTYIERRTDEATYLVTLGKPIPEGVTTRMELQLDELLTQAATLEDTAMSRALRGIQIHLRDQDQDMTMAMNGLPEGVNPQLTRLQGVVRSGQIAVLMGLEEPDAFRNQFRHQNQHEFQYQQGKPTLPITPTITSTITITPVISETVIPGQYGPGPCEEPGNCTPTGESTGPGPYAGTPTPGDPGQHGNEYKGEATPINGDGYGPGPENGDNKEKYPTITPKPSKKESESPYNSTKNKSKNP
jgi:hypothetical protein